MGYTFTIGDAVLKVYEEDLEARFVAKEFDEPNKAPNMFGDVMTGTTSTRSPSYIGWKEFCIRVGLFDLFYDEQRKTIRCGHPGIERLDQTWLNRVSEARRIHQEKYPEAIPGYWGEDDPNFNYDFARLIWLEFWIEYALKNCKNPCISNH